MRYRWIAILGLTIAAVFYGQAAFGDTVYLSDGSQLEGTVQTMDSDTLSLKTDFAGALDLSRDKIAGIETDAALPINLSSGELVNARLVYSPNSGTQRYVVDGQTKTLPEATGSLAAIAPSAIASQKRQARLEKYTLPGYSTGTAMAHPEWSGNAWLGVNGSSGNSETLNITAAISALRDTGLTRLDLLASANRASSDGTKTEENYLGRATYERDFSPRWYGFVQQGLLRDRFQDYALQSRTVFGPGYFLIRKRRLIFKLHTGLGYEYTKYYDSGATENALIATAGWHYGQLFGNFLKLTHDFDIYPRLSDSPTENFTLTSMLAATVPIADSSVWAISAQVENDYNNNPREADTDKLDTIYSLALQRSF